MSHNDNWVPFHFNGNLGFGSIPNREAWEKKVLAPYEEYGRSEETLLQLSQHFANSSMTVPNYGLYSEHTGPTLAEFFQANGMLPSRSGTSLERAVANARVEAAIGYACPAL
mgnify:FL=1